jgi:hypothetical protein
MADEFEHLHKQLLDLEREKRQILAQQDQKEQLLNKYKYDIEQKDKQLEHERDKALRLQKELEKNKETKTNNSSVASSSESKDTAEDQKHSSLSHSNTTPTPTQNQNIITNNKYTPANSSTVGLQVVGCEPDPEWDIVVTQAKGIEQLLNVAPLYLNELNEAYEYTSTAKSDGLFRSPSSSSTSTYPPRRPSSASISTNLNSPFSPLTPSPHDLHPDFVRRSSSFDLTVSTSQTPVPSVSLEPHSARTPSDITSPILMSPTHANHQSPPSPELKPSTSAFSLSDG